MFRVLIADDEDSVIHSLIRSVRWEELELEVAGRAGNGEEALALAGEQSMDIAILDIQMPGINGLELCERLKRINPQIQLIIISGYAEFAYAEKAIRFGVIGYCLKPLEYTQVTGCLRKAVRNLKAVRHQAIHEDLMEILERRDSAEIQGILTKKKLMTDGGLFVAVSISEKRVKELEDYSFSMRLGHGQWGYLLKCNQVSQMSQKLMKDQDSVQWQGIGYINAPVEAAGIYDALEECTARAYQYFVDRKYRICAAADETRANNWIERVHAEINDKKWKRVYVILKEIEEKGIQDFTVRSSLRLCNLIISCKSRDRENDLYIYSIRQLVTEYGSLKEMLRALRAYLDEKDTDKNSDFSNTTFMKLIRYIDENYRGNISLTGTAQALYMNPNYVSHLFKKEAGVTFVNYITQKRIEDAKKLLAETEMPQTDIAVEVGFNDYFYFIKTFKKLTGMTPGQYRAQK